MQLNAKWQYDPFFQQAENTKPLSEGEARLPVKYFDASSLIAFFLVDFDKAAALLPTDKVKLVRVKGNKAIFGLAFYDYRALSQGEPYFEVASSIVCYPANQPSPKHPIIEMGLPPDRRNTGIWILDLPVTTKEACIAGKELWGYPKFVTQIDFSLGNKKFVGSVRLPDDVNTAILTLQGEMGKAIPAPWSDLVLYSMLEKNVIRATVDTRTLAGAKFASKGDLTLTVATATDHPMAHKLLDLGLNGAQPLSITYTQSLQLRLNEGVIFC